MSLPDFRVMEVSLVDGSNMVEDDSVSGLVDIHTHSQGEKERDCCSLMLPQITGAGAAVAEEAESCSAVSLPEVLKILCLQTC